MPRYIIPLIALGPSLLSLDAIANDGSFIPPPLSAKDIPGESARQRKRDRA